MFTTGILKKYNTDELDISLHDGVPQQYYELRNKKFLDWEIPPWELYIFTDRPLGEGGFSSVYLAKWRETFVVAKVAKQEVIKHKKELFLREIDIMSKIHHPNIVQFLGYVDNPFIIVMEYIPRKSITDNIQILKKSEKISIMKDILKGLTYLHCRKPNGLIHRDIKPSNILLTNSKVAKITDFGLSKFYLEKNMSNNNLSSMDNSDMTNDVGTERYMASEVKNNNSYDYKIDIYSCGILLYELFENKKFSLEYENKWYYTPKKIKDLIKNYMINENPEDRYSALTLIKVLDKIL